MIPLLLWFACKVNKTVIGENTLFHLLKDPKKSNSWTQNGSVLKPITSRFCRGIAINLTKFTQYLPSLLIIVSMS